MFEVTGEVDVKMVLVMCKWTQEARSHLHKLVTNLLICMPYIVSQIKIVQMSCGGHGFNKSVLTSCTCTAMSVL